MVGPSDVLDILAKSGDITDKETDGHGCEEGEKELTEDGEWIREPLPDTWWPWYTPACGVFMTLRVLKNVTSKSDFRSESCQIELGIVGTLELVESVEEPRSLKIGLALTALSTTPRALDHCHFT